LKFSKYIPRFLRIGAVLCSVALTWSAEAGPATWGGLVQDNNRNVISGAQIELRETGSGHTLTTSANAQGVFHFPEVPAGNYTVSVRWQNRLHHSPLVLKFNPGDHLSSNLELAAAGAGLIVSSVSEKQLTRATGGENLSSRQVSELPLNKRDFSQLLLLAAGTMTDTNGSANFTQQFAVNGQRGTTAIFAMDGVDITDPELGGATFSNFNVDAVQEIQASSGVMPAEIGHGAAGFTNIITKSGADLFHGSAFEFVRNSDFDARNFFDRRTLAEPGRIPPFRRNEFGFALGGPVTLPGIYHGRDRTFFYGQYQGFRQVLSATEVLSVPTQAERQGIDTTAFPGDTLMVPVNPQVRPILADYPLPNDIQGAFGPRTYATSTKVATDTNQFSVRIDHRISSQGQIFARFNLNNTNGPLTNPDQSAVEPSFAEYFHDHQRNAALRYIRTASPQFTSETSLGYVRSTPIFMSPNKTQPAIIFADSLYEPFNSAAGIIIGAYGNLFQLRQNFVYLHGAHTLKFGAEARFNHDTTVFGVNPNGTYTFGGGPAYSPVDIPSANGQHDLEAGDALPDSLSGFLTATPFSYNTTVASALTAGGDRFDEAAIRREAYNFYFQDTWKLTPHLTVNYGLRYELNTQIHDNTRRTSNFFTVNSNGQQVPVWEPGARQVIRVDPQPPYGIDLRGWGPRIAAEWSAADHTVLHAAGGITTILPNLWFDNFLTGGFPFMISPTLSAFPGVPVPFTDAVTTLQLPTVYTTSGQLAFPMGRTNNVPPNTEIDVPRYQADLSALTPGDQPQPLSLFGMDSNFRNGYVGNYTAGIEHTIKDVNISASYVASVGVHLASSISPNSFTGASPEFARFTQFNSSGQVVGGFGPEFLMGTPSHSTYHAFQASVSKNSSHLGLGFQTNYTISKSLDDTSAVVVNFAGASGTIIQAYPQNPWNPGADKGPSTFDIAQVFTTSVIQLLPFDRLSFLQPLGRKATSGWQVLNITTFTSGPPFSVYSGIQQTGVGSAGSDRPDQIAAPNFSTSRRVREDYFGLGTGNPSFFSIPIEVPGGTGPNEGRFGTLGRNTFRGPGYDNFDMALIKDTTFGRRAHSEPATLQFRAEFFNAFNLVTFGLPVNVVRGSGFGVINHTAGTSRQIQFSLKLIY
jgi:hypothetical protein